MEERFTNKVKADAYRAKMAKERKFTLEITLAEMGFVMEAHAYKYDPNKYPQIIVQVTTRLVKDGRYDDLERLMKATA